MSDDERASAIRRIRPEAWIALGVFALGVLCYGNTVHGDFVFDDLKLIVNNDIVKDSSRVSDVLFTNLWGLVGRGSNYYRPLPPLLFMALHTMFGMRPEPFHAVNMLLHGVASALVFGIVAALFAAAQRTEVSVGRRSAAAAAVLFAVHPIHTEAVAWISGVMDVSCAAFSLLAVYLHIAGDRCGRGFYSSLLSPLALMLALLSKEPAIVVPLLIVGYDVLFHRNRLVTPAAAMRRWAPAFAALCVYLCLRAVALGGLVPRVHDGAWWSVQNVLSVPRLFSLYVGKLAVPTGLSAIHVLLPVTHVEWPDVLASAVLIAAIVAIAVLASADTVASFGVLMLVLPLAPVLYLPALSQDAATAFAERYAYLPSAGAAVLVAAAFVRLSKWSGRIYVGALLSAVATAIVFTMMTVSRNSVWHDSLSLWTDTVTKSPRSALAHENLGLALVRRGRECEGRREMRAALTLEPGLATGSLESGVLAARKGLTLQAVLAFQTALLFDPELVDAHYNLALAFEELGWDENAVVEYRETLARRADRADAHNNLGILLARHAAIDEAIEHFEAAVKARPADDDFRRNLERANAIKSRAP